MGARSSKDKKQIQFEDVIKGEIRLHMDSGHYFKALKRKFSLYKFQYSMPNADKKTIGPKIERIHKILNSDLGKLHKIMSLLEALQSLVENSRESHKSKIEYSIEYILTKLNEIYTINGFDKTEIQIILELKDILQLVKKDNIASRLEKIKDKLESILNEQSKQFHNSS